MFCPNCGKNVEDGQKFCPYCGSPMLAGRSSNIESNSIDQKNATNKQPKQKKKHRGLIAVLIIVVIVIILGVLVSGQNSHHTYELTNFVNMDEDEFFKITNYKKNDMGYYPTEDTPIYTVTDGKVTSVILNEGIMDTDDSFKDLYIAGLQPGMKFTSEDMKDLKDFTKITVMEESEDYSEIYYTNKEEDSILSIRYNPDSKKIHSIFDTVSSKDDIETLISGSNTSDSSQSSNEDDSQDVSDSEISSNTPDSTDTSDESTQNQNTDDSNEFIFPDSDSVVEDSGDIEQLSDKDLRIAINEIYARHGYHFKSADLQNYFSDTSWYVDEGITDQSEITSEFNKYEKENVENLTAERNARK